MSRFSILAIPLVAACASDPPDPQYAVHVHGALAQAADLAAAKRDHDALATAGEPRAAELGDFAHHVLLGTTHLGTPVDELLAVDQWRGDVAKLQGFYADPQFQAAFQQLFAAPVTPRIYERRSDWYGWGTAGATAEPYWYVIVEGRLALDGEDANRSAHDAVASGFEDVATGAGDVAHLPHLAIDDPRAFFNIDVWRDEQGMLAAIASPDFQAAFGALFEAPPTVRIYHSTDWHQWYVPGKETP